MYFGHHVFFGILIIFAYCSLGYGEVSVADLIKTIQKQCLSKLSAKCVRLRTINWINLAINTDAVTITDNLSIVKTGGKKLKKNFPWESMPQSVKFLNALDDFISSHSLRLKHHDIFTFKNTQSQNASPNDEIIIPLNSESYLQGRGFVRKAMIPFLLGLKLQTSILVPLALALIALKTWKALTFGLLSLVLSGAIVVFKLIKQNVINYEVVQPPIIEHSIDHHSHHHADSLAYQQNYHQHSFVDNHIVDHPDHHVTHDIEIEHVKPFTEQPPNIWQEQNWGHK